jgi:hypothetical protein
VRLFMHLSILCWKTPTIAIYDIWSPTYDEHYGTAPVRWYLTPLSSLRPTGFGCGTVLSNALFSLAFLR